MANCIVALCAVRSQNFTVESHQKINEINGGFLGMLNVQDNLGVAIDNIGDLDGNGVDDLAVGAFGDDDGGSNRGAVWILFLNAQNMVIAETKISSASGGFTGNLDNDDRFGGAVGYLGDMNGDGLIELAVTADYDGDGGFWSGAFYILSLNANGTVNSHIKISDTQGSFLGNINGDAIFGTDIENIGDLNGDGIEDLAVGSRRDNDGGGNKGALWILFMENDFSVRSFQKISDTNGNFTGDLQFEDYFGGSVANIGDLNNDGVVDLAVGSYRDDEGGNNSGSFYILFMNTDGTVDSHQQVSNLQGGIVNDISAEALFGESIDGVLDVDSDGKIEIIVGAMKQINPALSVPTGGFFIIELNNDGTVSEEHFYSYAENCFSGQLQAGDLFAGSVTILSDVSGAVSIAVGAYGDSENGTNKGAVWILNLGEVVFSISRANDPSVCSAADGSFMISDLIAGSNYTVTYDLGSTSISTDYIADANGEIMISSLSAGTYENINATEIATGCSGNLGQITLGGSSLGLSAFGNESSSCVTTDGFITISGARPGLDYAVNYTLDAQLVSLNYSANGSGEIIITGLGSGIYDDIMVAESSTGCSDNLGQLVLNNAVSNISLIVSESTSCDAFDGFITISGVISGFVYAVSYDLMSQQVIHNYTADSSNEIAILDLQAGNYDNIVITEMISGCSGHLGSIELRCIPLENECFAAENFFTPNGDGINDFWSLKPIDGGCDYSLSIFDRYGKLLAMLNPINERWDGTFQGVRMPATDYWFVVNYTNGTTNKTFQSHFTLAR